MSIQTRLPVYLLGATLLTSLSISSLVAKADDTPTPTPSDTAERVEVTGSHIRRTDVEGVSPVETVTKKDLEKKGYDNLGDVVKDLGVNTFGSTNTVSGNSTVPGNADISLRGLGADNTLVLLNGQRLPQDAITGTVDINLIPMAAVERIEILKDGASAIYGSDALGGVVNIITRKDFQGTEFSINQTLPTSYTDGKKTQVNVVNGINTDKLNVVTSLDYRYDQAIFSRNRDWSNNNLSSIGNPPSYSNYVGGQLVNGNLMNGQDGPSMTTNNCPPGLLLNKNGERICQFKYSDYSEEAPLINQVGVMSEAHYELNSDVRLNARVSFSHRDAETIAAPAPGEFGISAATATKLGGTSAIPGWDGTSPLDVNFRTTPLGTRDLDVTTNAYGGVLGATIQLPKDWQMDVTTDFNIVTNHSTGTGYALINSANGQTGLQDLMNSGTVNPFAAVGSQGNFGAASYDPTEDTKTVQSDLEAKASGQIAEGWAGPISLAVGSLVSYSDYYDMSDAQTIDGNVLGNNGSSGGGHRTSEAFYSELSVPLVSKKLELQVAGRFDHYSDFGSTVNPKIGLLYHASPSLLFRGSFGTGFRAPLLSELYASQSNGFPTFIDAEACKKNGGVDCQAAQYQVISGGNPGLKQETSTSWTLGTIFAPTPNANIGADWFLTNIANTPGIDYNDMTAYEAAGGGTLNPTTNTWTSNGVSVVRNSADEIVSVTGPLENLSSTDEMGIDLTGSYTYQKVKFTTEQNQLFYYKTSGFPGFDAVNKLGWNGLPNWRNTSSVDYFIDDRNDVSLISRTIPGQLTLDKSANLTPLTTFDVSYVYRTKKIGEFTLSLVNILNSSPPIDGSQPTSPVNYSLYDPNGRQVVLGYKVKI
jgi:iron complex outermembrane receptor protein